MTVHIKLNRKAHIFLLAIPEPSVTCVVGNTDYGTFNNPRSNAYTRYSPASVARLRGLIGDYGETVRMNSTETLVVIRGSDDTIR
jgi:hypothetical protein